MKNIVLIGMPGCGKTTIGRLLAKKLNLDFVDCDALIEKSESTSISQIFETFGEQYFRDLESSTLNSLTDKSESVISTGGGIVERPQNIDALKKCGTVVFLNRPLKLLLNDIDISERPLLKNGKDALEELCKRRFDLYKTACHIEIKNDTTIDDVISKIINEVKIYG
ncbi:MAG: shikimate kinase [Clostridia bacterium]|nr:shikimate kinase [Clostridia bacterium]